MSTKPIHLDISLSDKNSLGCGIYAIAITLNSLGFKISHTELKELAIKISSEVEFGSIYTQSTMDKILNELSNQLDNFLYEKKYFSHPCDLDSIVSDGIVNNGYVLIPYYAMQGVVYKENKPKMHHGHWAVIYDIKDGKIFGTQSNWRADNNKCLDGIEVTKFIESNSCLNSIKINWGKYNKCKVDIPRKQLEITPRCGKLHSCSKLTQECTEDFKCIYVSDLSNVAYILRRG